MDENVKTFSLCSNQRKLISHMNAEQKAELLDALFAFNDGEEVSVDDPLVDTVFMVMVETIERMRKFAAQKKANGQKGGRPKVDNNQDNDDGENTPPNETKNNQNESNANQEKPQYQYQYGINTPLSSNEDIPPRGETAKAKKETIAQVIDEQADILRAPLIEFVEHRKRLRKGLTPHALRLCIQKLESLAPGNLDRQKYLVEYAIMSGWQTFFEPKEDKPRPSQQGYLTEAERRQAHNDAVCRQVAAELEAADSPF